MSDIKQIPDENKLRMMLRAGDDCVPIVQAIIDKNNLPFIIIKVTECYCVKHGQKLVDASCPICHLGFDEIGGERDIYTIRSTYTNGELHLMKFITVDKDTLQMKDDSVKMAKTPYEVLIYGETGTGKEIIAKSQIADRKGEIKCVNCAGFPRELMEAELFGYVAGAFTDAKRTTDGLIITATGGVMFFDEIALLPMDLQAKLLRVMQERTVRKVGGKNEEKVDCKFVFATNRNLKEMVDNGQFMKDFYARISTLELKINNLKERRCDIVPITESLPGGKEFLEKYRDELTSGVLDLSLNVRSIQQYVIRYLVLGRITID